MQYKDNHKKIVTDLISGKFILWTEPHFFDLEKQKEEYEDFFEKSFGYRLVIRETFAYIQSENTQEKFSTNLTVFLSALCYEISSQGLDIEDKIQNGYFDISEMQSFISQPSYKDIFKRISMNAENLMKFLNNLANRNIVEFDKNQKEVFKFTKAIDLFLEFARELAQDKIQQIINK